MFSSGKSWLKNSDREPVVRAAKHLKDVGFTESDILMEGMTSGH